MTLFFMLYVQAISGGYCRMTFGGHFTVHYYYRQWRIEGTVFKIHEDLRKEVLIRHGKNKDPWIGVMDSQSVKTAEKRGFGAERKLRKSKGASVISLSIV